MTTYQQLFLARQRWSIFEFIQGLLNGEVLPWIVLVILVGCIAFFILYEKVTGESFVKSKKERRKARRRRKHVVWEYERDE